MKDGKIEYEMLKVAQLEREVIGQLASGDAEGLKDNLMHAKDFLVTMEDIQKRTEGSQNIDRTKRIHNTVEGLKRVIRRIGNIETVNCECCGDIVLKSATTQVSDGRRLCKSCIAI